MIMKITEQNLEEAPGIGYPGGLTRYDKQRSRHCLGNYISYTAEIMAGNSCGEIGPKIFAEEIQTSKFGQFSATNPGPLGNHRKSVVTGNRGGRD